MLTGTCNRRWPALILVTVLTMVYVAGTGCSRSHRWEVEPVRSAAFAPQPPPFLWGPMAGFLTNSGDFHARVAVSGWPSGAVSPLMGSLFGRGSMLFFALDPKSEELEKEKSKEAEPGFSYLWNVTEDRGFLLSEALQGFAPVASPRTKAGVVLGNPGEKSADGRQELMVLLRDGSTNQLRIWHDRTLNDFPNRFILGQKQDAVTVTFSKIRLQNVPRELFDLPAGFSRFASAEALVDELSMRQRQLHRRDPSLDLPLTVP